MFETITHLFDYFKEKFFFESSKIDFDAKIRDTSDINDLLDAVENYGENRSYFSAPDSCSYSQNICKKNIVECCSYSQIDYDQDLSEDDLEIKIDKSNVEDRLFTKTSFHGTASSLFSFNKISSACVTESRVVSSPRERLAETFSRYPVLEEEELKAYWAQVAEYEKVMTANLSGIAYIADLYLKRLRLQAKNPDKDFFLFGPINILRGQYEKDRWPEYLNELVRNFEANMEALKVAFANGDPAKIAEIQDFFNFQMTTLPVQAYTLVEWYKKLQNYIGAGDEGDKACMVTLSGAELKSRMVVLDDTVEKLNAIAEAIQLGNMKLSIRSVNGSSVPENLWEDAVIEGCMQLAKIVRKFDYSRGLCFSTYATCALNCGVKDFIRNLNPVKLSSADVISLRNVKAFILEFKGENGGKEPTVAIIAENLDLKEQKVRDLLLAANVKILNSVSGGENDGEEGEEGEPPLPDHTENPAEVLAQIEQKRQLYRALGKLSEKHRKVIIMSFGLHGSPCPNERMKNVQIARLLNVTPPRVGQLYDDAMKKLKEAMMSEKMIGR